jgi:Carbohydrate family 9 binding domain-like/Domain of unknown function (DUF5916)
MRRRTALAGLVCLLTLSLSAQIKRAPEPIRVDAQLDERAWAEATPIPIAYEWYPADDAPAPVETTVKLTFDEGNLYAAFIAKDPQPSRIRARFSERDASREDDVVGLYIDPFNDDRRAYQFRMNPLGVQIDAINSDVQGTEDFSWDAIWESAGRLTADGYIVEIAIPLQQLRVPAGRGPQTWGFLAVREWPRDVKHRLRSTTTDQDRNCFICQFHDVSGFEIGRVGRNAEVTPTLTGSTAQARNIEGDLETIDETLDLGASARWAITPGTSLQATINPDFSQVEADSAQLDVNTRFALFFPEKRPFFVEGSDFFETRLPLVFTRTIADPSGGLKVTGKTGPHAYGVLFARDEITNLLVPSDQSSFLTTIPGGSTTGIARYRRELGKNTTAGGLMTLRRGVDYENTVLHAEAFHRLTEQDSVRVEAAGSSTRYPTTDSFGGHSFRAGYSHNDRNWSWGATYIELSPDFRADSGFINQVGVRQGVASLQRRIRGGPERWFRNLYLFVGGDATRQFDGNWNEWGSDLTATYEGPRQSTISIGVAPNQEYYAGTTYHHFRQSVSASFQASRDVALGLAVRWGESIDFTNQRSANFVTISPAADFNIGRRFRGEIAYDHQWFDTKDGRRVFTVDLPQARFLYHFSSRAFTRAIVQYRSLERDPLLYVVPVRERQRDLLTQLLFSYRLDAQTVFLAGYSDDYDNSEQVNRAVFAKVSYAFLF